MVSDDERWNAELGERVQRARKRANLTQRQLAVTANTSKEWVSRIERGLAERPGHHILNRIAAVLGADVIPPVGDYNVVGPLSKVEARLVPVYMWGAAGDPRSVSDSPDPDHEEHAPIGKESLVGAKGFGVVVRGESMAERGIHDGDIVWINPERPVRRGRPVLARVWDDFNGGMVVKSLVEYDGHEELWSEGDVRGRFDCSKFDVIGPVVGISPAFRLPR